MGEIERFSDKARYESVSNQLLSLREKIEGDASPINKITEYLLNCSRRMLDTEHQNEQ